MDDVAPDLLASLEPRERPLCIGTATRVNRVAQGRQITIDGGLSYAEMLVMDMVLCISLQEMKPREDKAFFTIRNGKEVKVYFVHVLAENDFTEEVTWRYFQPVKRAAKAQWMSATKACSTTEWEEHNTQTTKYDEVEMLLSWHVAATTSGTFIPAEQYVSIAAPC